jgi:lactoylglutathione lyase
MTTATAPKTRSRNVIGAFGIGVSDLERSVDFYARVLGMVEQRRIKVSYMDEVLIGFEGRPPLVLMHYTDGSTRNYTDNPIKLVIYVDDPVEIFERVRAEGLAVVREPAPSPEMDGAIIALIKDPDGYILEFIQRPQR